MSSSYDHFRSAAESIADRLLDTHDGRTALADHARAERYQVVMKHEFDRLTLSDGERGLIEDVLASSPPTLSVILSLDSEVAEAMRPGSGSLARKWRVDASALAAKLSALTTAQKCAVVEAFERGRLRTRGRGGNLEHW